jgi:hypothetical protein
METTKTSTTAGGTSMYGCVVAWLVLTVNVPASKQTGKHFDDRLQIASANWLLLALSLS